MRRLLARLAAVFHFLFRAPHVHIPGDTAALDDPWAIGNGFVRLDPDGTVTLVEHAGAPGTVLRSQPIEIDEALRSDGTVPIKIISPGWGTTGYYPADVLERDAAVFAKGTHMYLDHPSMSEAIDRPERSVRDLAAVLATPGRWVPDHPKGPGIYAEAEVLDTFRPVIDQLGPHIGVSIRAAGTGKQGTVEGRSGTVVEALTKAHSVDFVTKAGRGGQVLSLLESAGIDLEVEEAADLASWFESRIHLDFTTRADDMFGDGYLTREERIALSNGIGNALDAFRSAVEANAPQLYQRGRWDDPATTTPTPTMEESSMALTDQEKAELTESVTTSVIDALTKKIPALAEAAPPADGDDPAAKLAAVEAENASLREAQALSLARTKAAELAGDACKGLPDVTRLRVVEAAATAAGVVADGKVDEAKLTEAITAEVKTQTEYLEAAGVKLGGGEVTGLGGGDLKLGETAKPVDETALEESLRATFGLTKPAA